MAQSDIVALSTKPDGTFNWGNAMRGAMTTIAAAELERPFHDDSILVASTGLSAAAGSPTFGFDTGAESPRWSFAASANGSVANWFNVDRLQGWSTFNIYLWWANLGAGAGDVRFRASMESFAAGGSFAISVYAGKPAVTVTAAAQGVLTRTLLTGTETVPSSGLVRLTTQRNGQAAADTLGNALGLYAVELVRVT
jgi:hypothetical protein